MLRDDGTSPAGLRALRRQEEPMPKRRILLVAAAFLLSYATASATEKVANGSFETGNFAGWAVNVIGTPFIPWLVSPAGLGAGYSMAPTQPQDMQFDAWNGFDGSAGTWYTLYQDVNVPQFLASPAVLKWKDRVQWNFALTNTATMPRTYAVQLRDLNGAILATLYSFSTGTALVIGDTGWQTHTVDISAYAGSTIRLWFEETIPESFTGPGQLEVDAVSLDVADYVSIDSCNTGIPNRIINAMANATLQQYVTYVVDTCSGNARNHGDFVSCVTQHLNDTKGILVTGREKGAITSCAAQTGRRGRY